MFGSPKRSALLSGVLHAAAIVLVLLLTTGKNPPILKLRDLAERQITLYIPTTPRPNTGGGGGGGGFHSKTPPSLGEAPRTALRQIVPPMLPVPNDHPVLTVEPAIVAELPIVTPAVDISKLGSPMGTAGRPSQGPGTGNGFGNGDGGGIGDRRGPGMGNDGDGGGISNGRAGVRGAITAPVLVSKPEPEYSDDARNAKLQGIVTLSIEVDAYGQVGKITVRQGLGLGLDEKAIEAVRQWRFRPATQNGKPIAAKAVVEVTFRLL